MCLKDMGFFKKGKKQPFEGLVVTHKGVGYRDKNSDMHHLTLGDIVRVCVDYLKGALEPKNFNYHHLIYSGHFLGRDYFLANYQAGIGEYSCKREKIKVMKKPIYDPFIVLNNDDRKFRMFDKKKNPRAFNKRWMLIQRAYGM